MSIDNKYSSGKENIFNLGNKFKSIVIGEVVAVGKITPSTDPKKRKKDERFNADRHAIRVKIPGLMYDSNSSIEDLPNCFPLLPKHLNFIPELNEQVMVILPEENSKGADRYYIGPFISNETKFSGDYADTTSSANKKYGLTESNEDIDRITPAKGIYENPKHVVIDGRNNTDIIQRDAEILIRAGKFVQNNPKQFNEQNPGYFQIKYNQTFSEQKLNNFGVGDGETKDIESKNVTVTNIVSNKINLLTYDDKDTYDLTYVDETSNGAAKYINDDEMNNILNYAHPLVFGDILIEYLKLLREALTNHVHQINKPPSKNEGSEDGTMFNFIKRADELEKAMLSKNIRIN